MTLTRVLVVGTGLIGTSIALALREHDIEVALTDRDEGSVRLAVEMGAGVPLLEGVVADLAVVAVPPGVVGATLLDVQKRGVARFYTDVASVKEQPISDATGLGCDMGVFVAGHPLAGRERSGPAAARGDLFLGRPWALCPTADSQPEAIEAVTSLATLCGAETVIVEAAEHDRAVALVSHAPHVVSAAMAARLGTAPEVALGLAGQGVRDVTRIAAGDPALWIGILGANSAAVAEVLEGVVRDLEGVASALRLEKSRETDDFVGEFLERGGAGTRRLPGKHGGRASSYALVTVLISDRPGELALLFQAAGVAGCNIEDVTIEHSPGLPLGVVELSVRHDAAGRLADELRARGWSVPGNLTERE
jgi:prephenate dehydrogenase